MELKRPLRHDLELQSPSGQRYSRRLLPLISLYCKAATLSSGAHNIKTNFQTIKPDHHYSYKPSGSRGTVANGRYCHVDKGMPTATALIAPFTVTRGRGRTTIGNQRCQVCNSVNLAKCVFMKTQCVFVKTQCVFKSVFIFPINLRTARKHFGEATYLRTIFQIRRFLCLPAARRRDVLYSLLP